MTIDQRFTADFTVSSGLKARTRATASGAKVTGVLRPSARECITVERLMVWVYRDQKADLMSGKGLHGLEAGVDGEEGGSYIGSTSCVAKVEMNGLLGTIIRSTAYQQRPCLHPDAEKVHDIVLGLPWHAAGLLMRYGRSASSPDWGSAQQRYVPVERMGEVIQDRFDEVVEAVYKRERRRVEVRYCPVALYPSDECIATSRAVYEAWVNGLCRILPSLHSAGLQRWAVRDIGAEWEPWNA